MKRDGNRAQKRRRLIVNGGEKLRKAEILDFFKTSTGCSRKGTVGHKCPKFTYGC